MTTLKEIKHEFMTFRNGIVADTLRKAGMDYDIIFGLQIPQLSRIARQVENPELAEALWRDKKVRESRLLACCLFAPETVDEEMAMLLSSDVQTREEADILCFRLLRRLPYAESLAAKIESAASASGNALQAYCAEALRRNLA